MREPFLRGDGESKTETWVRDVGGTICPQPWAPSAHPSLCVPPAPADPNPLGAMCSGRGGWGAQLRGYPGTEGRPDRAGCGPGMRAVPLGGAGGRDRGGARAAFIPPSSFSSSLPPPPPGARSPSRERAAGGRMLQTAAEAGGWAGRAGGAGAAIRRGVGTAVARAKLWEEGDAPGGSEEQSRIRAGASAVPAPQCSAPLPLSILAVPPAPGSGQRRASGWQSGDAASAPLPHSEGAGSKGKLVPRSPARAPAAALLLVLFRLTAGPRPAGCEASPGHGVPVRPAAIGHAACGPRGAVTAGSSSACGPRAGVAASRRGWRGPYGAAAVAARLRSSPRGTAGRNR